MAYRYQINFVRSDELNRHEHHILTGSSLTELIAKLILVIAKMMDEEEALREQRKVPDDDIPF